MSKENIKPIIVGILMFCALSLGLAHHNMKIKKKRQQEKQELLKQQAAQNYQTAKNVQFEQITSKQNGR